MSLSVEQHVGDLKMLIAYMSDPEKAKESASRSDEERKKRWAETISKTATKYGFDSSEAYLAAVKKLEDEDEVKELREQMEQLMKNRASGK